MVKLIYAGYLLLTTIALVIVVQLLWGWIVHRRLQLSPLVWLLLMVGVVGGVYLWQYQQLYPVVAVDRRHFSETLDGPLHVAAVWPSDDPAFFEGARRAVAEINTAGGVALRKDNGEESRHLIELVEFASDDDDRVYRAVAQDRRLVAVIGHHGSREAVRASIAYDASGLLYIVPTVTLPALTNHSQARLIRIVPDDAIMAGFLRDLMRQNGLMRIAVLHARGLHGETLARYVSGAINEVPGDRDRVDTMSVVLQRSYLPSQENFHELITELVERRPDAIVVADDLPRAAHLIRQIRQRGLRQPILGGPSLEERRLFDIAGRFSDDVIIPSLLPMDSADHGLDSFAEAQAYDAIRLLAAAWERTGSAEPGATAATLRGLPAWPGLRGTYDFLPNGDVDGWTVMMKRSQDRQFLPVQEMSRAPLGAPHRPAPTTEGRG